jgi:hypothetical protein
MKKVCKILEFIFAKILTWQFIVLIILIIFYTPLINMFDEASSMKIGSFQLTIKELSESEGLKNLTKDLQGLTYEELKIFLIICSEDAQGYSFYNSNYSVKVEYQIYEKLKSLDLIDYETEIKNKTRYFITKTTDKGEKAHKIIIDAIYMDFIKNR